MASSTVSYRSAIDGLRTVPTAVSIGALGIVYGDLRLKGSRSNAVAQRSLLVSKCTPGAKDADHTVIPWQHWLGAKVRGNGQMISAVECREHAVECREDV